VSTLIIFLAVNLLAGLLFFEKTGNQKGKLPAKTILSCLFIFTAGVQFHPAPGYFYMLLIGLVFRLGGDVFLALPREKMFLFGLVSFLLGHVFHKDGI
jgi:alkenylglycerophosphocholine hydrolase